MSEVSFTIQKAELPALIQALINGISEFEWSKDYENAEIVGKLLTELEKVN